MNEENKEQTGLEKLKSIKLFEGKTLDEIFSVIYENSIEERSLALDAFRKYTGMIKDENDLYMSGQTPQGYLDSAHKATENIIKMITASQKLMNTEGDSNHTISLSDVQTLLDKEGVAPERFVDNVRGVSPQKKIATGTDSSRLLDFPQPQLKESPKAFGEKIEIKSEPKAPPKDFSK